MKQSALNLTLSTRSHIKNKTDFNNGTQIYKKSLKSIINTLSHERTNNCIKKGYN